MGSHLGGYETARRAILAIVEPSGGHLGLKKRWDTTQDCAGQGTGGRGRTPPGTLFERNRENSKVRHAEPPWAEATGGGGSTTPTANHRRPLPLWSGRSGSSRGRRIAQMLINLWFLHVFCASALVEVRLTTCRSETRAAGSAPHRFALSVLLSRTKRLQCRPSRQHRKVRRAFPELRRNEMGERACSMCGTVRGRLARHSGASGADMGAILG